MQNKKVDTFANRLRCAMDLRGIKQSDLAALGGFNKAKVSQWVNGKFLANQDAVYVLSQILRVDPGWLLGYDVLMEPDTVPAIKLTKAEQYLLDSYRNLNSQGQDYILQTMDMAARIYKKDACVSDVAIS